MTAALPRSPDGSVPRNLAKPRVLLTRRWPDEVENHLRSWCALTTNPTDRPMGEQALAAAMDSFDIICPTITDRITPALVEPSRRVRAFCNFGAGLDHIDLDACRRTGTIVTNTPDVLTDDTADLAILLMLMVARRASEGERRLRAGSWAGWRPTDLLGTSLRGLTLGLLGFGRIGQAVAARAGAFSMKVIYHARRDAGEAGDRLSASYVTLEALFRCSDILSLHCPGGPGTRGIVDEDRLRVMKPTAFLINTARGDIVDEAALVRVLTAGGIAGAGLDVYADEPRVDPDLVSLPNVALLPHLGSATRSTRVAMGMRAAENLRMIASGQEPRDRIC